MNVGTTIILEKTHSIFSNGIFQNVLFLRELFEKCSNVENSYIINIKNEPKENFDGTVWEKYVPYMISLKEAEELCDVIVLCHGYVGPPDTNRLRSKGKKVVKVVLGASQSMFNERIVFNQREAGVYRRQKMDAVWTSPHFYERDKFFYEAMHDCPVYVSNYIWEPEFLDDAARKLNFSGYTPSGSSSKRLVTAEPNINMVKTCTAPLTIAELWQRKSPDLLKHFVVFCGDRVKDNKDMIDFAGMLDIHSKRKCAFLRRFPLAHVLSIYTDIMLCHQNQCELNYLYLDTAWMGYPIVHNSPMMKELGWYYPENDAEVAIKHLDYIATSFDTKEYPGEAYRKKSQEFASRYFIKNNVSHYEHLLAQL